MEKWKTWNDHLANAQEDVRAEVLIADLWMDAVLSEDEFFLLPNGGFHRMVGKDVSGLHQPGASAHNLNKAVVELNRKGIYDGLPESLFHQSRNRKSFKSLSEIKDEIRYQNEVEQQARRFFAPVDHELIFTRCKIEQSERVLTSEMMSSGRSKGLQNFWKIPSYFTPKEIGRLLLLLPLAYKISGRVSIAAEAISSVLQVDIDILEKEVVIEADMESRSSGMGGIQLGLDMVTAGGSAIIEDGYVLRIGPLDRETALSFAVHQVGYRKLLYLGEYFLPADLDVELDILIKEEYRPTELSISGGGERLGVTTFLER